MSTKAKESTKHVSVEMLLSEEQKATVVDVVSKLLGFSRTQGEAVLRLPDIGTVEFLWVHNGSEFSKFDFVLRRSDVTVHGVVTTVTKSRIEVATLEEFEAHIGNIRDLV